MVPKDKINNISENNKAMLIKLGTSIVQYCTPRNTSHGANVNVALAILLVPHLFYAEWQSLFFVFLKPNPLSKPL